MTQTVQLTFSNGAIQRLTVERVEFIGHCAHCRNVFWSLDPAQRFCGIDCEQKEAASADPE